MGGYVTDISKSLVGPDRDCLLQDLAPRHTLALFPPFSCLVSPILLPISLVNTPFLEKPFLKQLFFSKSVAHESLYQGLILRTRPKLVSRIYNKLAC